MKSVHIKTGFCSPVQIIVKSTPGDDKKKPAPKKPAPKKESKDSGDKKAPAAKKAW